MDTLIAVIAVHTVGVNHKVKLLAFLVERIHQQKSVLMMHVIIARSVSQLQHHRILSASSVILSSSSVILSGSEGSLNQIVI